MSCGKSFELGRKKSKYAPRNCTVQRPAVGTCPVRLVRRCKVSDSRRLGLMENDRAWLDVLLAVQKDEFLPRSQSRTIGGTDYFQIGEPSQGSVPAGLTLPSDLSFVFNASRVRVECCVDPLRPPDLPGL